MEFLSFCDIKQKSEKSAHLPLSCSKHAQKRVVDVPGLVRAYSVEKRILKLDRLRLRGPCGAKDEFHLAATAQNLRKLARLIPDLKPVV